VERNDTELIDGAIPIFHLATFKKGEYRARLRVTSGAPRLKGVDQKLEGRYVLCGLEAIPAAIALYTGIAASAVAGVIAVALLLLFLMTRFESSKIKKALTQA
jgi:hypothetical protein